MWALGAPCSCRVGAIGGLGLVAFAGWGRVTQATAPSRVVGRQRGIAAGWPDGTGGRSPRHDHDLPAACQHPPPKRCQVALHGRPSAAGQGDVLGGVVSRGRSAANFGVASVGEYTPIRRRIATLQRLGKCRIPHWAGLLCLRRVRVFLPPDRYVDTERSTFAMWSWVTHVTCWVYEDDPTDRVRVHEATCTYCNDGKGRHASPLPDNRWHGPSPTLPEAIDKALTTGPRRCGGMRDVPTGGGQASVASVTRARWSTRARRGWSLRRRPKVPRTQTMTTLHRLGKCRIPTTGGAFCLGIVALSAQEPIYARARRFGYRGSQESLRAAFSRSRAS